MNYPIKISVIIPVFNVESFLPQCLTSVINQTYSNLEIILVDDGSTDLSGQICDEFAMSDGRIRVIHQENSGVSSARNAGIELATGEYLTFVDSDDWLEADMYQCMAQVLQETEGLDVVMCDFVLEKTGESENITANIRGGKYKKKDIIKELYPNLLVTADLGRLPIVATWNCLFKKELLLFNKITFDVSLKYAEDYLFMAEIIISANSFYYLKDNFHYHYRQYDASRSKRYQADWWNNLLNLNSKLKSLVHENKDYDFSNQVQWQLIHSALFVSGAISRDCRIKNRNKVIFLRKVFNDDALVAAFHNLRYDKQPFALKMVLYLFKHKAAVGYMVSRKLIETISKLKDNSAH